MRSNQFFENEIKTKQQLGINHLWYLNMTNILFDILKISTNDNINFLLEIPYKFIIHISLYMPKYQILFKCACSIIQPLFIIASDINTRQPIANHYITNMYKTWTA